MQVIPESHRDLLEAEVASLSTVGPDDFPQVTMVWFVHEDGKVKLSLNTSRKKTRNLQERPKCSLVIVDPENPYRYVEIRARAIVEPDDDYVLADTVGRKYGTDLRSRDEPGESRVSVTLEPVFVWPVKLR